ncbi:MAG: hypothetical protein Q4A28_04430 [Brachymonas sp.]|nr:hypothetical protein [Brachymonas sp.]
MKPATTAFQWARFKRLLRAQWAEQRRGYGRFWLVVAAIHGLVMLISLMVSDGTAGQTSTQALFFWLGLFASGIIFSGLYFSALRRPESTLLLLTRPATALEKWLSATLFILLAWPLAYTLSATLINALASNIGYLYHSSFSKEASANAEEFALFIPLLQSSNSTLFSHFSLLLLYTGLSGYALFGGIYFRKNAGIKTGALAFVIFLLTVFISASILPPSIGALMWWKSNSIATQLFFRQWLANLLFWLVLPALIWLCALLALREKDLT